MREFNAPHLRDLLLLELAELGLALQGPHVLVERLRVPECLAVLVVREVLRVPSNE